MSSRATWHSPTRKLREGSSTATFTQVGNEGEDATSLISWVEPSLTQQRLLSIVRPRTSICNSKAQICKEGFKCHASAASNISNASKVQCNVCTAWVLLWLTVNIRHAAKMIRLQHPNDNGFWRNTLRQVLASHPVPSASSQGLEVGTHVIKQLCSESTHHEKKVRWYRTPFPLFSLHNPKMAIIWTQHVQKTGKSPWLLLHRNTQHWHPRALPPLHSFDTPDALRSRSPKWPSHLALVRMHKENANQKKQKTCATWAVEFRKLLIYLFGKWNHVAHMTSNKIATLCHKSKYN